MSNLYLSFWLIFSLLAFFHLPAQPSESGELLIVRQTGALKSAEACYVWIGDSLLMRISNKSAGIVSLPKGSHHITLSLGKSLKSRKTLQIEIFSEKLSVYQCRLLQRKGNKIIPSQGFYFSLRAIPRSMITNVLEEQFVSDIVKEYLYQKWKEKFKIERK